MGNLNKDKIEKDLHALLNKLYTATDPVAKLMVESLNNFIKQVEQSGQNTNNISGDLKKLQGTLRTVYKEPAISSETSITGPTPTLPSPSRSQPGGGSTPGLS